jgi:maltose-binding protein MalE
MSRKRTLAVLTALMLAAIPAAFAQKTGPNGGLLAGKEGGHQTELVVSPTELVVYVIDHGKVHDSKGIKIKAVVQEAGKTATIDLVPADGKKIVGKLTAPLGKGAIVVLTGKDDHGDVVSARYVIN